MLAWMILGVEEGSGGITSIKGGLNMRGFTCYRELHDLDKVIRRKIVRG